MGFYNEAITHLPFVLAIHNVWRAKQLFDMNYGTSRFRMRDSAKVAKILLDAGKGSQAESVYVAGPQSVTQVLDKLTNSELYCGEKRQYTKEDRRNSGGTLQQKETRRRKR